MNKLRISLTLGLSLFLAFSTVSSQASDSQKPSPIFTADELKDARANLQFIRFNKGEMRGYNDIFTTHINKLFPVSEQEESKKLYSNDLSMSYEAKDQSYAWVDLNNDNNADPILLFTNKGYCGSVGCSGYVFLQKDNNQLSYAGQLTVKWESLGIVKLQGQSHSSLFSENECLLWDRKEYKTQYGYPTQNDGENNWNPHACGNHY